MPTNLPPEFFEADRRFREAKSIADKSSALEELIKTIPKHKGTDKLRADYRKKLSKLKSQTHSKKKISRHESHFHIEKEGDVRVIVVGTANVGKSSIVNILTHAKPEISASPYSTWIPTPGMYEYNEVRIQLIDTPAIDRDYLEPELLDLMKNSDLILLMLDLQAYPIDQFQKALNILQNNRIFPLLGAESDRDESMLHKKMLIAVNKDDGGKLDEEYLVLKELLEEEGWIIIPISVKNNRNIEQLFNKVIEELNIIRVYSKPPGKDADLSRPFVLIKGSNIEDFAEKVHKDFLQNLRSARIWGSEVFDGQKVGHDHILHDGDIVELHI